MRKHRRIGMELCRALSAFLLLTGRSVCFADEPKMALRGPYLGQKVPSEPEIFAPGILCTGLATRDLTMMPDGSEIYFSVFLPGFTGAAICWTRIQNGEWTEPEVAPFAADPRWKTLEPCISPDGKRFYFSSNRPDDPKVEKPGPFGIWMMERTLEGWSAAHRLPKTVNGESDTFYPSVTRAGTLYYFRETGEGGNIYRSSWRTSGFSEGEKLPAPFNLDPKQANPRIDPEEQFLIVPMFGRKDSLGGADYYIHFRRADGTWTEAMHLDAPINSSDGDEFSASLSPDGKVFFFGSARTLPNRFPPGAIMTFKALKAQMTSPGNGQEAMWWVNADFLAKARIKALAKQ